MEGELDFTLKKKKKKVVEDNICEDTDVVLVKKKKKPIIESPEDSIPPQEDNTEPMNYRDMLSRIYTTIAIKNPTLIRPEDAKIHMKPVKAGRVGTSKTAFINFLEECRVMNRDPEHVSRFFAAETASKVSINEENHLMLRGRYSIEHIETILIRYINDYVKCLVCKSGNTRLERDAVNRMQFLHCNNCFSKRSVLPINVVATAGESTGTVNS